jgi:hypothetical protein
MFFKKNDILVLKNSVEFGRAYDGVFLSEDHLNTIVAGSPVVVTDVSTLVRNDRDTQYVVISSFPNYKLPSSIFNKVGEMLDTMQVNDTHYFRSKKTYDSLTDYLLDD